MSHAANATRSGPRNSLSVVGNVPLTVVCETGEDYGADGEAEVSAIHQREFKPP